MWFSPWKALTKGTIIAVLAVSFAKTIMTPTHHGSVSLALLACAAIEADCVQVVSNT